MNRNEWEFEITASVLAEAAREKVKMHTERKEWWEKKFQEAKLSVPQGIEVHDSVASHYSNTKGRYQSEVVINPMVQRDLEETQSKLREHESFIRDYEGWAQVLDDNAEARLKLHHDDWLFFFGK